MEIFYLKIMNGCNNIFGETISVESMTEFRSCIRVLNFPMILEDFCSTNQVNLNDALN